MERAIPRALIRTGDNPKPQLLTRSSIASNSLTITKHDAWQYNKISGVTIPLAPNLLRTRDMVVCNRMVEFSAELFWDCDPATLDLEKHKRFIIHRVLTRGRWSDWKLLRKTYPEDILKEETMQMRQLDPRSLAFCSAIFGVPREDFRCYSEPTSHWPY